jgi:hypothetical protein
MVPWSNDVDRIKELVFSGLGPPPLTIEGVLAGQQAATLVSIGPSPLEFGQDLGKKIVREK